MIALSQTETRSLMELYALANTPEFLYRKLRQSQDVQRLADESQAKDLIAYVRKIGKKKNRRLEEVSIAYAALVALTLMEKPPTDKTFKSLEKVKLDWGADMIQRYFDIPTAQTSVKFTIPPVLARPPRMLSAQS